MLQLQGLKKQYGGRVLFEGVDAQIGARARAALIGPNGSGKTTLLRLILGKEEPDAGRVSSDRGFLIGHLAQEIPKGSQRSILQEVMQMDGRREGLLQTRSDFETAFSNNRVLGKTHEDDLERYGQICSEIEHLDEYRLESRAQSILMGMGFRIKDFSRSVSELSGGWIMRVMLARLLLLDPDLLILDEPTNHLDLESLLWLENFLKDYRGGLLLVSHDTEFVNRVVSEVYEIDQRKLSHYRGNLDAYRTQKQERLAVLRAQFEGQQSRIKEIEDFVARFGAKATKARQAQSRLKELDRMDRIEMPDEKDSVGFRFPPAPHSGKEVVTFKKMGLSYGSKKVFDQVDWVLQRGSRIALVGVNGAGKTSFLKLLSDDLSPTQGERKLGHMVQVGYYAQHQSEQLNMNKTILEELEAVAPHLEVAKVRAIAGAFLFTGDAVFKKCGILSGGEKARVALAKLLLSPANFLILDEPTNHLDIESRGVLLEALDHFEGTLMIVSHDRAFIGPLIDTVVEIIPDVDRPDRGSKIVPLLGSYDDYLKRKIAEAEFEGAQLRELEREQSKKAKSALTQNRTGADSPGGSAGTAPTFQQKRAWERQLEKLEKEVAELEEKLARNQEELVKPESLSDRAKLAELAKKQTEMEKLLESKMDAWGEVAAKLS